MPSRPLHPVRAGLLCLGLACLELVALPPASRAISVSEVVKAFCLSAYQANLQKEGKTVSPSQLDRTCGCVGDKVAGGSDVEDAHAVCGAPHSPTPTRPQAQRLVTSPSVKLVRSAIDSRSTAAISDVCTS